jgi:HEAT repeat protein
MGPAAKDAVPALAELLKEKDDLTRCGAALALARVGAAAVPALTALANDNDPGVRRAAAWALAGIGPAGKEPLQALLLERKDGDVSFDAESALRSMRLWARE